MCGSGLRSSCRSERRAPSALAAGVQPVGGRLRRLLTLIDHRTAVEPIRPNRTRSACSTGPSIDPKFCGLSPKSANVDAKSTMKFMPMTRNSAGGTGTDEVTVPILRNLGPAGNRDIVGSGERR